MNNIENFDKIINKNTEVIPKQEVKPEETKEKIEKEQKGPETEKFKGLKGITRLLPRLFTLAMISALPYSGEKTFADGNKENPKITETKTETFDIKQQKKSLEETIKTIEKFSEAIKAMDERTKRLKNDLENEMKKILEKPENKKNARENLKEIEELRQELEQELINEKNGLKDTINTSKEITDFMMEKIKEKGREIKDMPKAEEDRIIEKLKALEKMPAPNSISDGNPEHKYFYDTIKDRWYWLDDNNPNPRSEKHWAPFDEKAKSGLFIRYDEEKKKWFSYAPIHNGAEVEIFPEPEEIKK